MPKRSGVNSSFTPLPVYHSIKDYMAETSINPMLYRGVHQAETWEATLTNPQLETLDNAELGEAWQTDELYFSAKGTEINVRVQTDVALRVIMDGTFDIGTIEPNTDFKTVTIRSSLLPEEHLFIIEAESPFIVDSILIRDDMWRNVLGIGFVSLIVILGLGIGLWRKMRA